MRPEQARGRWDEVVAKSVLWAVGAVMFAALAGKHVHEAPTVNEQLLAAMTVPAEPLEKAVPGAPPELAALVDRALAFDKANRFANAREMRDAVRATYLALEGKPLVSAPRLSVRPPSVNPISANMATLDGSAEALAQVTTARPVIQGRPAQAPGSSRKLALGAALAVAALVGAWLLVRAPADAAHAESSAAGSAHVAAPSAAVPAGMHAELPAPAPEDRPSPSATVPSAVASAPPTSPKPAPVKRVAAPRSGSAPAADVDIFSKRR
jgi:serine/threonine-protein kinase